MSRVTPSGGALDLLGIGPTAISLPEVVHCQNQRNLGAWSRALTRGERPVERGLTALDPDQIERRELIHLVMCQFRTKLDQSRLQEEGSDLELQARAGCCG